MSRPMLPPISANDFAAVADGFVRGDQMAWCRLTMLLLELPEADPEAVQTLLAKALKELRSEGEHNTGLAVLLPEAGPAVRQLMAKLTRTTPQRGPRPKPPRRPAGGILSTPGRVCCDRCGEWFTPNRRGRPRKRCWACAPGQNRQPPAW